MRAKQYAANLRQMVEDGTPQTEALVEMTTKFLDEFMQLAKLRNIRAVAATKALFNEGLLKWQAVCRLAPEFDIPEGVFNSFVIDQFGVLMYTFWRGDKANKDLIVLYSPTEPAEMTES